MTVLFSFPRGVLSVLWLLFCNVKKKKKKKRLLLPGKTITLYNKSQSQQSVRELVKLKSTNMTQHTCVNFPVLCYVTPIVLGTSHHADVFVF